VIQTAQYRARGDLFAPRWLGPLDAGGMQLSVVSYIGRSTVVENATSKGLL
jgi:hypothetical protein